MVVVYKVDRLTRSLADFAKLVELFDAHGVSFVSVTQAFNTTTSMGRLTLNVLLSFAQFEREVTGERIRDKIAASKKKGLWMGGVVPLGYRLEERKLYVDQDEAAAVRLIFDLYLELGSIRALQRELKRRDIRTRVRMLTTGKAVGGLHLTNGPLSHILHNRHYLGEINHHGRSWSGEHPAIIDPDTFETVQARLEEQRVARAVRLKSTALLRGKLFNEAGERLTPTYAVKDGVRYGYYVSTSAMQSRDRGASPIHRLPAASLETAVVDALRSVLQESGPQGPDLTPRRTRTDGLSGHRDSAAPGIAGSFVPRLATPGPHRRASRPGRRTARSPRGRVSRRPKGPKRDRNVVDPLDQTGVAGAKGPSRTQRLDRAQSPYGVGRKEPADPEYRERPVLARGTHQRIGRDIAELAARENRTPRSIRMTLSLAFLDPALIDAACAGTLPRGYGVTRLMIFRRALPISGEPWV